MGLIYKDKLRAWLIDLVRVAIRLERIEQAKVEAVAQRSLYRAVPRSIEKAPVSAASFESMQAEAIQQCEVQQ